VPGKPIGGIWALPEAVHRPSDHRPAGPSSSGDDILRRGRRGPPRSTRGRADQPGRWPTRP